ILDLRDASLRPGANEMVFLVRGPYVQPGNESRRPAFVFGQNGEHILALHKIFADLIFLDRAPFSIGTKCVTVEIDRVMIVGRDPQLRLDWLGGQSEGAAHIARLVRLSHLVRIRLVPDPGNIAPPRTAILSIQTGDEQQHQAKNSQFLHGKIRERVWEGKSYI